MSRRPLAFVLAFVLAAPARAVNPASERTFTLDDAVKIATLNNVQLLTSEQSLIIAQERVTEARFLFLPEFGLLGTTTRFNVQRPFALSPEFGSQQLLPNALLPGQRQTLYSVRGFAQYTLYAGQRNVNTLRLAEAALDQARTDYEAVRMDIVSSSKRVFFRMLGAQERAARIDAALAEVEAVDLDKLPAWEQVEAESLRARFHQLKSEASRALESARLGLARGLNMEADTQVKLVGELEAKPVSVDLEKATLWAIELRPELRSQVYGAQIDAIQVSLAQSRRIPTVVLGADYELVDQDFPLRQNNYDLTLGVRVPLSYTFWTELRQRRAEQRQGELRRSGLQDQVRLEVTQSHQDLTYWQQALGDRRKVEARLKELYDKAARGPKSTLGMLRGRLELLLSQLSYLEAVEQHNLAKASLERAVGREL